MKIPDEKGLADVSSQSDVPTGLPDDHGETAAPQSGSPQAVPAEAPAPVVPEDNATAEGKSPMAGDEALQMPAESVSEAGEVAVPAAADDTAPPADGTEQVDGTEPADGTEQEASEDQDSAAAEDVQPIELAKPADASEEMRKDWYILKVQVNREESIRDALQRRVKIEGLDSFFGDIIVPTEDVAEFTKTGKRRIVKRKLYPSYIMVNMAINDDTWFLVRETPGIGDFTGSAGKPTPMIQREVERILNLGVAEDRGDSHVKTAIPFKTSDRVRVKEGYFQNFEGDVESVDEANGRVTVMINIFGRSTPVELEHWQIEAV